MENDARVEVECFPAEHGDSFLVRCTRGSTWTNILIDGGTANAYKDHVRPRLDALRADGQKLHLVVVSHVDADHIEGVLAFLRENGEASATQVIDIDEIWHNSYRHLHLPGRSATDVEIGRVRSQANLPIPGEHDEGPISARQGSMLAGLIRRGKFNWNTSFGGAAASASPVPILVGPESEVQITVLAPDRDRLQRLARLWRRELLTMGVSHEAVDAAEFEEFFESLLLREFQGDAASTDISARQPLAPPPAEAFQEDESLTNGSSIALLVEFHGIRALFLGDAPPSALLSRLPLDGPLDLSMVKVSHHGSRRSTSPDLLRRLRSPLYVISTDGKRHQHPDLATLLWIIDSPGHKTLAFNYRTRECTVVGAEDVRARYDFETLLPPEGASLNVILRRSGDA